MRGIRFCASMRETPAVTPRQLTRRRRTAAQDRATGGGNKKSAGEEEGSAARNPAKALRICSEFARRDHCVRLDVFLKLSRLCPRRTLAQELCDAGFVLLNGRPAKSAHAVN